MLKAHLVYTTTSGIDLPVAYTANRRLIARVAREALRDQLLTERLVKDPVVAAAARAQRARTIAILKAAGLAVEEVGDAV